jgi:hypothetical protein
MHACLPITSSQALRCDAHATRHRPHACICVDLDHASHRFSKGDRTLRAPSGRLYRCSSTSSVVNASNNNDKESFVTADIHTLALRSDTSTVTAFLFVRHSPICYRNPTMHAIHMHKRTMYEMSDCTAINIIRI